MGMHDSQQIANEQRNLAAHNHHTGAEHHGKEEHPGGHESSRRDAEHVNQAYLLAQKEHQGPGTGQSAHGLAHEEKEMETAALAYQHWQDRGCPIGSPEHDWTRAADEIRARR
jgi:hypothetical protein